MRTEYSVEALTASSGNRRKASRVNLKLSVELFRRDGSRPVHTVTENVSVGGMFCYSSVRFGPGEELGCRLLFPTIDENPALCIEAKVAVVWVTCPEIDKLQGVGLRIISYSVSR